MYQLPMVGVDDIQPQIHPQAQLEFQGLYSPAHQMLLDKLSRRGIQKLDDKDGVSIIKQIPLDSKTKTCSREYNYHIYPLPKKGQNQPPRILYKARKKMEEQALFCIPESCRALEFVVTNATLGGPKEDEIYDPTLKLIRQLKGPICCRSAQILVKSIEDGEDEYLGKVMDDGCFGVRFKVYDKEEKLKYTVEGSQCQIGMCFNSCSASVFKVKSGEGKEIAKVIKEKSSCCYRDKKPARLELNFPKEIEVMDKAYLMAVMLMIEYKCF